LNFTANETVNIPNYHYRLTDPSLRAIGQKSGEIKMREKLKEFGILVIRTIGEWAKGFAAFSVSRSKPINQAAFDDRTDTFILTGTHHKHGDVPRTEV